MALNPIPALSIATHERVGHSKIWMAPGLSLILHMACAIALTVVPSYESKKPDEPIRMQIRKIEKEKKVVAEPEPPKPEPKVEPKPKDKPKVVSERKPLEPPKEVAKPIQGLSPDALSPQGTGISAPVGNTLMVEDDGKRHKAEDVKPLSNQDLSADARLIGGSIVPPSYTEDAIDANLEGTILVEVLVDAAGQVTKAELPKKVGYGMDDRIIAAVMKARFEPRKDKFGKAIPGWTEIKFRLEIP